MSLGTYVPEQQQEAVTASGSRNMNVTVAQWHALIAAQREERRQQDEHAAAQQRAELRRAGMEPVSPAQWRARLAATHTRKADSRSR